jgi:hypothetical protein
MLVLADGPAGEFTAMPYVDEHGEPDKGLRRGCRTKLSEAMLKKTWRAWVEHRLRTEVDKYMDEHMPVRWTEM